MPLFKSGLRALLFGLFLITNPAYFVACSGGGDYEYTEQDMLAIVGDINAHTWTVNQFDLKFELAQSSGKLAWRGREAEGWVSSASACGSRTLVKSASACVSTTEMPLSGTLTVFERVNDGQRVLVDELEVSGTYLVLGPRLISGQEIFLAFDQGEVMLASNSKREIELTSFLATNIGDLGATTVDYELYAAE